MGLPPTSRVSIRCCFTTIFTPPSTNGREAAMVLKTSCRSEPFSATYTRSFLNGNIDTKSSSRISPWARLVRMPPKFRMPTSTFFFVSRATSAIVWSTHQLESSLSGADATMSCGA